MVLRKYNVVAFFIGFHGQTCNELNFFNKNNVKVVKYFIFMWSCGDVEVCNCKSTIVDA